MGKAEEGDLEVVVKLLYVYIDLIPQRSVGLHILVTI